MTNDDHIALSRRQLVGAGAAVAGVSAVGLAGSMRAGALQEGSSPSATPADGTAQAAALPPGDGFIEPPVLESEDGLLVVTLQAMREEATGTARLGYNAMTPGPTLRFRPGDTVKVTFVNALTEGSNLHVHGLHVDPTGNSDNIFLHIDGGQTFNYEYAIPADHPPGLYWYHPHPHGHSSSQVGSGLAGAIIVEGALDDMPEIAALKERLFLLQGPFSGPDRVQQNLVNGQMNPSVSIAPGETQRWRIANVSANQFYNLQLTGHSFHRIANDGNPLPEVQTSDIILLGPGERAEVLVQGGSAGIYELRSLAWAPDIPSQSQEQFTLATVIVGGEPVEPAPLPTTLMPIKDLTDAEIATRREITFKEANVSPAFNIDGKAFVEDRVDQVVKLNTVEEWVIRNESPEWHPFHIHVNDFQVMSVNGDPVAPHYEDTVLLPPHGEVVIRNHFRDFTGRFVYHCHILVHEDAGMMATIEVVE
jgi:suppressor of ftsI